MKAKIYFCDDRTVTMTNKLTFENFLNELFKSKIYASYTEDGTANLGINTNQILFVEEVRE